MEIGVVGELLGVGFEKKGHLRVRRGRMGCNWLYLVIQTQAMEKF